MARFYRVIAGRVPAVTLLVLLSTLSHGAGSIEYQLSTGFAEQNLEWSIAGNLAGTNPNVLSELTWSDLQMLQAEGAVKLYVGDRGQPYPLFVEVAAGYGWIFAGENRDHDFSLDDRQGEISRSVNDADDGSGAHYSVALGVEIELRDLKVSPRLGYGRHELDLTMTNGNQVIPSTGPFPGLDSTYEADWWGPFVGVDARLQTGSRWHWFAGISYAWNDDYEAEANWNLRADFAHPVSFRQFTEGHGLDLELGVSYLIKPEGTARIGLVVTRQTWDGESGIDTTFFADGTRGSTQLNEVTWDSTSVRVHYSHAF